MKTNAALFDTLDQVGGSAGCESAHGQVVGVGPQRGACPGPGR